MLFWHKFYFFGCRIHYTLDWVADKGHNLGRSSDSGPNLLHQKLLVSDGQFDKSYLQKSNSLPSNTKEEDYNIKAQTCEFVIKLKIGDKINSGKFVVLPLSQCEMK